MIKAEQKLKRERILIKLAKRSFFTLADAKKLGVSHPTILRLVKSGALTKLERGLYAVVGSEPSGETADFVVACRRYGKSAVIGGLTALFHYRLIDEVPTQLWVLVAPDIRTSNPKYRLLRTKRRTSAGVIEKDGYRITSLERTLIDGLLFASKLGESLTKKAVVRALRKKLTNPQKIFAMASKLNALTVLESEWQSILAGVSE